MISFVVFIRSKCWISFFFFRFVLQIRKITPPPPPLLLCSSQNEVVLIFTLYTLSFWFLFLPEKRHQECDPFNQNFWKFRYKTEWIGSAQLEKFWKMRSNFQGGPLLWSDWLNQKFAIPFDHF